MGDYYFATHEVDPADLARTAAPFELVESLLQDIAPRRKLFLMDTCESGELDPGSPAGRHPLAPGMQSRALVRQAATPGPQTAVTAAPAYLSDRDRYIYNDVERRSGAIVLSSSRGSEASYELDELHNGAFTEAVLRALVGASDADGDGDGKLSARELAAFVARDVSARTAGLQHPTVDRDNVDLGQTLALPLVPSARAVVDR